MKVNVKRFDTSVLLPAYKTAGAAGFDLSTRIAITIEPKQLIRVPLGVALRAPSGYWVLLVARSSLPSRGLVLQNGVGVVDADYSGDSDEYQALLYNYTDQAVTLAKGERIVQGVLLPLIQAEIEEVQQLGDSRGGFGSTGR
jgi:dUTP pyrophosphatase